MLFYYSSLLKHFIINNQFHYAKVDHFVGCYGLAISLSSCKSIFTGIFLLLVSGLHAGWAIWRVEVREPWASFTNLNVIIFIMMSWYMFAVIGGVIGAVMVTKMRKKIIYVSQQ